MFLIISLNGVKPQYFLYHNTFYNSCYKFYITVEWVFLYSYIRAVSYAEVVKRLQFAVLDPEFQGFPSCCYHKVFKNLWFLSVTIYVIFSEICLFQCPLPHISEPLFCGTLSRLPTLTVCGPYSELHCPKILRFFRAVLGSIVRRLREIPS